MTNTFVCRKFIHFHSTASYKLEACESPCHEYPSNYEVENYKHYIDVDRKPLKEKCDIDNKDELQLQESA